MQTYEKLVVSVVIALFVTALGIIADTLLDDRAIAEWLGLGGLVVLLILASIVTYVLGEKLVWLQQESPEPDIVVRPAPKLGREQKRIEDLEESLRRAQSTIRRYEAEYLSPRDAAALRRDLECVTGRSLVECLIWMPVIVNDPKRSTGQVPPRIIKPDLYLVVRRKQAKPLIAPIRWPTLEEGKLELNIGSDILLSMNWLKIEGSKPRLSAHFIHLGDEATGVVADLIEGQVVSLKDYVVVVHEALLDAFTDYVLMTPHSADWVDARRSLYAISPLVVDPSSREELKSVA